MAHSLICHGTESQTIPSDETPIAVRRRFIPFFHMIRLISVGSSGTRCPASPHSPVWGMPSVACVPDMGSDGDTYRGLVSSMGRALCIHHRSNRFESCTKPQGRKPLRRPCKGHPPQPMEGRHPTNTPPACQPRSINPRNSFGKSVGHRPAPACRDTSRKDALQRANSAAALCGPERWPMGFKTGGSSSTATSPGSDLPQPHRTADARSAPRPADGSDGSSLPEASLARHAANRRQPDRRKQ